MGRVRNVSPDNLGEVFRVLTDPFGHLLGVSPVLPRSANDLAIARTQRDPAKLSPSVGLKC